MTPRRRGVGTILIAAGALAVIIVAAVGVLVLTNRVNNGNNAHNATKTGNCCTDASLNLSTPCSTILTPNYPPLQRLELSIETDSSFTAAEDGHNYTANGGVSCGFAVNPGSYNGTTVEVGFTYTTDNQYTNNCGNVWNVTYYLNVKVPLTEAGYDMSAIQILPNNSSNITVTCTSSTSSQGASTVAGPSVVSLPQPPYIACSTSPGISEITVNGTTKCVVGPPIVVNDDGVVDFRNGTGVDLYANLTGSSFIAGTSYDTVVTLQATRFIFDAHGLIATIYPYQGREVFANGTITTFPACTHPISTSTRYPSGTSGNGTVNFPAADGGTVWFYPNGTCSETNG